MRAPTDADTDRIVLTEAGSEMEGIIAGMSFEKVKKSGGSHGQALVKENGKKYLIAGTLTGDVYRVDLATGKKEGPIKVGQKFCGAITGPDGNIYFEDMADGNVYVFDPVKLKTVEAMPVGNAVCGIQWTKNAKKAYITDMPTGTVYVYDWTTKKKIKDITSPRDDLYPSGPDDPGRQGTVGQRPQRVRSRPETALQTEPDRHHRYRHG